ncbi:Putative elongator complex protein 4 [Toxocara canis]|uniref:Elongator complex protein 4 n=1 Tax=Toxocara canis TaxID=6265 RepID=A0A0B2W520_TOXCA|nr:Putative elongator complex protein 4 [Toxocara canis]
MVANTMNLNERARINGTTVRLRYLETSVGNSAIDRIMGGGLPMAGIYLVDEHNSRKYSSVLAKYFLAEGVCHKHSLFVASPSRDPSDILTKLPEKVEEKADETSEGPTTADEQMKIAWRYASVPKVNSSLTNRKSKSQFDLTKTMDKTLIESCEILKYPSKSSNSITASYSELWRELSRTLSSQKYRSLNTSCDSSSSERNLLRIFVEDFGSPMWEDSHLELKFLARMKAALNDCYAVLMLTMNSNGIDPERKDRIYSYCNAGFILETVEEGKASTFGDHFDGYFRIIRLPAIPSIGCHCPESSDLTFELHRRRFDVKILHLPPVMDDVNLGAADSLPCQSMLNAF